MAIEPNPTAALDEIVRRLAELYPPRHTGKKMAENGEAGTFHTIRAEVDFVRDQLDEFKTDINARLSGLSSDIKGLSKTLAAFIQEEGARGSESLLKVGGMVLGIITVCLTVAGYIATLQKTIQDTNIQFTNDRITTVDRTLSGGLKDAVTAIKDLTTTTIPRAELDARISANRDAVKRKEDKDVVDQVVQRIDGKIVDLRSDVERLKGDIVSRRENESHWDDYQNRISQLSNRVTDLARETNGASLADQIKGIQEQLNLLQQKFVVVPGSK